MATNKKEHLEEVLETHKMSHINSLFDKYKERRKEIKEDLESNYGAQIYAPLNSGSYAKHTAINIKFDLDLVVPFKKASFTTLEEMFDSTFDFLQEKYKAVAYVRKQKVSIGIEFYADVDGDVINIDVVPARELNQDQYEEDRKLNLYVNSTFGLLSEKTYLQTNIHAQIEHIKSRDNERKVIRLLKIWKAKNHEPYKSFFLELAVIRAFDKVTITGNIWDKLKSTLEYIRDNVTEDDFKLVDPGNSGNDVVNTLDQYERQALKTRMDTILNNIVSNDNSIKIYFPINQEFEDQKDKYEPKRENDFFSLPPNKERFG